VGLDVFFDAWIHGWMIHAELLDELKERNALMGADMHKTREFFPPPLFTSIWSQVQLAGWLVIRRLLSKS
jgi:hypothetical protein